jgi:acyl-CoA synthetase (AMP-forming)/AMP-acid ligase II
MNFLDMRATAAPALIDAVSGQTTSYRQLLASARTIADHLGERKSLVFLLARSDAFTATVYAATQLGGHAVALLDASRPVADCAALVAEYEPEWIAGPPGTARALEALGPPTGPVAAIAGGELLARAASGTTAIHPELALLLGTSGTTGSRKYVRLSASNVEANARSIASYLGLTPEERPITSLPLHYSFGLSVLNSHWLAGAAVVLSQDGILERPFWDAVRGHVCTSLAGVPFTYQLLERIGYRDMDLPSLLTMQQAGGAMSRSLIDTYASHMAGKGGRLFVMYGQTEATARIAYVPPERLPAKVGSAGIAIPGGRLRIETKRGPAAAPHEVGEVVYEGPNVMLGYAEGRRDLAKGDQLRSVLRTGDIGYLDEDDYLWLTGRSKRIAKVFGLRVNLDEVEAILRESGPAAVIAADDRMMGFCAFGTDQSLDELRRSLSRRMRVHPSAIELHRVRRIPVHSTGKTDYDELERWASELA